MIIRVGFWDTDEVYISRLADYFNSHPDYAAQLEIYLCTSEEALASQIARRGRLDVIIAKEDLLLNPEEYAKNASLALWSNDKSEKTRGGLPTVCRYQKASDIFKQIQSLSANSKSNASSYSLDKDGKIILFVDTQGGAGSRTAALGCALHFATLGKNAVYFSLKQNDEMHLFEQKGVSMTDVCYEIGLWRQVGAADYGKLQLKLQSMIKRDDETGVAFFEPFDMPVSAYNVNADDIEAIFSAIKELYDVCVVSIDGYINAALLKAIRLATWTVLVSDSTEDGNRVLLRLANSFEIIDSMDEKLLYGNIGVVYNKFGSRAQKTDLPKFVHELGVIPKYRNAEQGGIVHEIAKATVYAALES